MSKSIEFYCLVDEYLVHKSFKKKDFLVKILFMLKKENSRVKIVLVCCYLFKNIFKKNNFVGLTWEEGAPLPSPKKLIGLKLCCFVPICSKQTFW